MINAYTSDSKKAAKSYSDLHANIQDAFAEAGVEIMSPHYRAARDGGELALPPKYIPEEPKIEEQPKSPVTKSPKTEDSGEDFKDSTYS